MLPVLRCGAAPFSVDFLSPPPYPPYPPPSPRSSFTIIAFTREGMIKKKKNCISSAVPEGKSWDPCLVYSQQEKRENIASGGYRSGAVPFRRSLSPFFSRYTHPVFPLSKVGRLKLPPSCLTKGRRPHSLPPDTDGSDEPLRRRFDPEALVFLEAFSKGNSRVIRTFCVCTNVCVNTAVERVKCSLSRVESATPSPVSWRGARLTFFPYSSLTSSVF